MGDTGDNPLLTLDEADSVAFVRLRGPALAAQDVDALHAALWRAWAATRHDRVVIDFSAVNYMSSLVLGLLVEFSEFVSEGGGTVRLAGMKQKVREVFAVSELHLVLDVRDDPATAFEA